MRFQKLTNFRKYSIEKILRLKKVYEENPQLLEVTPFCPWKIEDVKKGTEWFFSEPDSEEIKKIQITGIRSSVYFYKYLDDLEKEEHGIPFPNLLLWNMEPAVFYAPYPKEIYPFESFHGKSKIIYPPLPKIKFVKL